MLRAPALLFPNDVTILGAGVIGLSLALELHRRGAVVTILEKRAAGAQASWAAAGMLAVEDPENPPQLKALATLSAALYPAFLDEVESVSGHAIPFQTQLTTQTLPHGGTLHLRERSIDPRQLAVALLAAVQQSGIRLVQHTASASSRAEPLLHRAAAVVHATGAWAEAPEIFPRKGQMLRVKLPEPSRLREVYRSPCVYVVPRTAGPQAGTALIGATVEDAGFDTSTCTADLSALRRQAGELVPLHPELADPRLTPMVEAWAGLRPATADGLPLLGAVPHHADDGSPRHFLAAGHFRNGILLAPATAVLLADLIENRPSNVDLAPFSPARFTRIADHAA